MRMTFKRLALLGGHPARGYARIVKLTPARLDFVLALADQARCQRQLAEVLCVSEAVISRMVRVLAAKGLVQRHIPLADKRFRIVSLTKEGREVLETLADHEQPFENLDVDSQALSEAGWLEDWREPLQAVRLEFLQRIADGQCSANAPPEPPYAAMRMQWRKGVYRHFYGPFDTTVTNQKLARMWLPGPPPLHLGVVLDTSLDAAA